MAIPAYTYTEQSGIRFTRGGGDRFLFMGVSTVGTANTVIPVPRQADIPTLLGQGPMPEALALANAIPGSHGPHYAMRLTAGVASAWGSITKVDGHSGPTITLAGANDRYEWKWQTLTTGALGVGTGRYTLDGGYSWSAALTIPSGGTYLMPNSGGTITFPAGTYTAGEEYTASSTEPYFSTANLSTGVTAALADTDKEWDGIFLIGAPADATAGASMYGALETHLATLATNNRYVGAILDVAGLDTTGNTITAFAALANDRILPLYGSARVSSAKKFVGWSRPMMSASVVVSARAASSLVSESLGRVKSGQLAGVTHVDYDEFVTGALNDSRIATLRSFPANNPPGFYVTYDHVKGDVGSDVIIWPMRRVADRAARIVSQIMLSKILENFPTNSNGTLLETAAKALEEELNAPLRAQLKNQRDRSGRNGHVSDIFCSVDTSNDYATDRTINVTTLIRANQPAEQLTNTLSFTAGSVTGETENEPPEEPEE